MAPNPTDSYLFTATAIYKLSFKVIEARHHFTANLYHIVHEGVVCKLEIDLKDQTKIVTFLLVVSKIQFQR